MRQLIYKELLQFFGNSYSYITLSLFLLFISLFFWIYPESSIFSFGFASMQPFFYITPWVLIFYVSAISTQTFVAEKVNATLIWLISKPISVWQLVLFKYVATLIILLISLLPTLVYVFSLYQLANPVGDIDFAGIIGSYIGLILLAAVFCAIGLLASAIANNLAVAFTMATFLNLLFYTGFSSLSSLFIDANLAYWVSKVGIQEHYQTLARGVMDSRDIFYFLVLILILLYISQQVIASLFYRPKKLLTQQNVVVVLILCSFIFLTSIFYFRLDFTSDKRYTLSQTSQEILREIDTDVRIEVYLDGKNLPPGFKRLQIATRELLQDFKSVNGSRIRFEVFEPLVGLNDSQKEAELQRLSALGIEAINVQQSTTSGSSTQLIFPSAMVIANGEFIPVSLLQRRIGLNSDQVLQNSIQNLEHPFISAIQQITSEQKIKIAFTEGHGELTSAPITDAIANLAVAYDVQSINLKISTLQQLSEFKTLIIAKPTVAFAEDEKFKLDQFLMYGGSLFFLIDQLNAETDSLRNSGSFAATGRNLNLDDMLFNYGVRLNYNLIQDLNSAQIPVLDASQNQNLMPWLYFPLFITQSKHPIVKNLDAIRGEYVGTIDLIENASRKTVLLHSSPFNKIQQVPAFITLNMREEDYNPQEFSGEEEAVAVLLEGDLTSVFKNRTLPSVDLHTNFKSETKSGKIIVASDGDLIRNQISALDGSIFPLGFDRYTQQTYSNKAFMLNAVDFLSGRENIINLRNKELPIRLLDKQKVSAQKTTWQIANTSIPILFIVCFGFLFNWYRKRNNA